jgi:hypothetical protein
VVSGPSGSIEVAHEGPAGNSIEYDPNSEIEVSSDGSGGWNLEIGYDLAEMDARGHYIAPVATLNRHPIPLIKETVLTGVAISGPNIVFTTKDVYVLKSENPGTITLDGTDCSS